MKKLQVRNLPVARWSGGTTTEFLVFPATSSYAARDFQFRISSAVIEDEHSLFTSLPDFERILLVLDGSVELTHDSDKNMETVSLETFESTRFSGSRDTRSRGKITDFNVIFRPSLQANVQVLENSSVELECGIFFFLWCLKGSVEVSGELLEEGCFTYGFLEEHTTVSCNGRAIRVTLNGLLP